MTTKTLFIATLCLFFAAQAHASSSASQQFTIEYTVQSSNPNDTTDLNNAFKVALDQAAINNGTASARNFFTLIETISTLITEGSQIAAQVTAAQTAGTSATQSPILEIVAAIAAAHHTPATVTAAGTSAITKSSCCECGSCRCNMSEEEVVQRFKGNNCDCCGSCCRSAQSANAEALRCDTCGGKDKAPVVKAVDEETRGNSCNSCNSCNTCKPCCKSVEEIAAQEALRCDTCGGKDKAPVVKAVDEETRGNSCNSCNSCNTCKPCCKPKPCCKSVEEIAAQEALRCDACGGKDKAPVVKAADEETRGNSCNSCNSCNTCKPCCKPKPCCKSADDATAAFAVKLVMTLDNQKTSALWQEAAGLMSAIAHHESVEQPTQEVMNLINDAAASISVTTSTPALIDLMHAAEEHLSA